MKAAMTTSSPPYEKKRRESLSTVIKMPKGSSSHLTASGRRWGRTQFSSMDWPLGVRPCSKEHMDLVSFSFSFFGGGGVQGWEGGPGKGGHRV